MTDLVFRYNYDLDKWIDCTDEANMHDDIEKIPTIQWLRLTRASNVDDAKLVENLYRECVFCPKHKTFEDIEEMSDCKVITKNGCILYGLLADSYISVNACGNFYYYCYNTPFVSPFRWRIFQRSPHDSINLACDVAEIVPSHEAILRHWVYCGISVHIGKRKLIQTNLQHGHWNISKKPHNIREFSIPLPVEKVVMELLQEQTKLYYGIKPPVLTQMNDGGKIIAYCERPFDLHIVYLKNFLHKITGNDFERIFPFELKDNYAKICSLLNINPPKSIRKAYTYNPYAIVWYMIFRKWKIKDINFLHKFWRLDKRIADIYLEEFYYDSENDCIEISPRYSDTDWIFLQFYVSWSVAHRGEKKTLDWLYTISEERELNREEYDTMLSFYEHHDKLSREVKELLIRYGITQYVHDAISWEVTLLMQKEENVRPIYDENVLSYECKINDYEFHLAHCTNELVKIGISIENCVATYRRRVIDHQSIIFYVRHKKNIVACIELDANHCIVQALGKRNQLLTGDVLLACRYWRALNQLSDSSDFLNYAREVQDWISPTIEKLPHKKLIEEMNVNELLAVPSEEITRGYYHRLGNLLQEKCDHVISAPEWKTFDDEKEKLMFVFPQGERIYNAAINGNAEAMFALGCMYYNGRAFKRDYDNANRWFLAVAKLGNEPIHREARRMAHATTQNISHRDRKILQAIDNLRKMVG